MLGGQGGAGWALQVRAIYNPERIVETLRGALDAGLQGQAREDAIGQSVLVKICYFVG